MTLAAVLLGFVAFATPAAADIAIAQADTPAYALTAGRLWSLVAAAIGLIGVVMGGLARIRALGGTKNQRRNAFLALLTGLAGSVIGGVVVVFADGGPGSGSGIVGGYLALVIGLLAIALGWLSLKRPIRTDPPVISKSRA
jgi:peptidoglycan/LPS O-acetylase OafA/YrhL